MLTETFEIGMVGTFKFTKYKIQSVQMEDL